MNNASLANVTFLWPAFGRVSDGFIVMNATGYQAGVHWTGERSVGSVNDPFWSWGFANRFLFPPIMDESFLPGLQEFWNREIAGLRPMKEALVPPDDGNYVSRLNSSSEAEEALTALFSRFDENTFVSLSDFKQPSLSLKLLTQFCRGLSEVFCFRGGKCAYFAALAKEPSVVEKHLTLLGKHILP